ncbi:hypothetical protein DXG01_004446 [Tephrocybe rancida]|nr:hypothetical protein DXG01_004446 [Tephrocybe rancida]
MDNATRRRKRKYDANDPQQFLDIEAEVDSDASEDETEDDQGDPRLWRVAVKVSRPGCLIVEARSSSDVEALCHNVSDVYARKLHVVEPKDVPWYLTETNSYTPQAASWVRLTKRPYNGDLAFVKAHDNRGAEVFVIPRINLQDVVMSCKGRREQQLVSEDTIRAVWPKQTLIRRALNDFTFRNKDYLDGFLRLVTDEFQPQEAVPTSTVEVSVFENLHIIPSSCFQLTLEAMGARRLGLKDPVKVVKGKLQGVVGVVVNIIGDEATIDINNGPRQVPLPVNSLCKHIAVGDQVKVTVGLQEGISGWVTGIDEEMLSIYDDKSAQQVIVPLHCVSFNHPSTLLTPLFPDIGQAPPGFHEETYLMNGYLPVEPIPDGHLEIPKGDKVSMCKWFESEGKITRALSS